VRPRRWSAGVGRRSSLEQSTGTSVTATNSDMPSENMTTMASCLNITLEMPVRNSSGTNTEMWVRMDARMADQTSSLPSIAAWRRSLPNCSMCRNEFSRTTIEASTIMPTPRARPPKVIVFSVKPEK
jgi:hypothetical protein